MIDRDNLKNCLNATFSYFCNLFNFDLYPENVDTPPYSQTLATPPTKQK